MGEGLASCMTLSRECLVVLATLFHSSRRLLLYPIVLKMPSYFLFCYCWNGLPQLHFWKQLRFHHTVPLKIKSHPSIFIALSHISLHKKNHWYDLSKTQNLSTAWWMGRNKENSDISPLYLDEQQYSLHNLLPWDMEKRPFSFTMRTD